MSIRKRKRFDSCVPCASCGVTPVARKHEEMRCWSCQKKEENLEEMESSPGELFYDVEGDVWFYAKDTYYYLNRFVPYSCEPELFVPFKKMTKHEVKKWANV